MLHLLGDDLSILSRQRDGEPSRVAIEAGNDWDQLFAILDRHNELWVDASSSFGVPLLLELLRLSGDWTQRWYATVDADSLGEPIAWISPEPAPYWLLTAREYLERWIHHQQIRRAIGRPGWGIDERWGVPAVAVAVRGFPLGFGVIPVDDGTTVTFAVDGGPAWTVARERGEWSLFDGAPADPTTRFSLDLETAALLFSRAMTRPELEARVLPEGDTELGGLVVFGLSAFFGREV